MDSLVRLLNGLGISRREVVDYLKSVQWNDPGTGSFLFWFIHILFFCFVY